MTKKSFPHLRVVVYCLVIVVVLLSLSSCQGGKQSASSGGFGFPRDKLEDFPCWFHMPSPAGVIGSIGISRDMTAYREPQAYARLYALQGLYNYLGWEEISFSSNLSPPVKKLLTGEKKQVNIKGKTIRIPDTFTCSGYVYAYAAKSENSISGDLLSACPEKNYIDPAECEPSWICSPNTEDLGGVVGVSFRASSPQRQYRLAVSNALTLLEYTYGVEVKGKDEVKRLKSAGTGNIKIRSSTLGIRDVASAGEKRIRIHVKQLRHKNDTLYLWLVSPELPSYSTQKDLAWLKNPGDFSIEGGIGQCRGTPSGLLSDQIHVAARRGIKSLVRNNADALVISEEMVKKGTYQSYYYNGVETKYHTKLHPRVRGFYVDEEGVAYVWVVFKGE